MSGNVRYKVWIPFFRFCHVSEDKVLVTAPLVFGRGYLFDRSRRVVTIFRRIFGMSLTEMEVPFEMISDVEPRKYVRHIGGSGGGTISKAFELVTTLYGTERVFRIESPLFASGWKDRRRAERTQQVIRRVTGLEASMGTQMTQADEKDLQDYLLGRADAGEVNTEKLSSRQEWVRREHGIGWLLVVFGGIALFVVFCVVLAAILTS